MNDETFEEFNRILKEGLEASFKYKGKIRPEILITLMGYYYHKN